MSTIASPSMCTRPSTSSCGHRTARTRYHPGLLALVADQYLGHIALLRTLRRQPGGFPVTPRGLLVIKSRHLLPRQEETPDDDAEGARTSPGSCASTNATRRPPPACARSRRPDAAPIRGSPRRRVSPPQPGEMSPADPEALLRALAAAPRPTPVDVVAPVTVRIADRIALVREAVRRRPRCGLGAPPPGAPLRGGGDLLAVLRWSNSRRCAPRRSAPCRHPPRAPHARPDATSPRSQEYGDAPPQGVGGQTRGCLDAAPRRAFSAGGCARMAMGRERRRNAVATPWFNAEMLSRWTPGDVRSPAEGSCPRRRHRGRARTTLPQEADRVIDVGHARPPRAGEHAPPFLPILTRPPAAGRRLFDWLVTQYPIWARLDGEAIYASARTVLAELALSGCTTASDHLYLFPNGARLDDEIRAAREIGVRLHACRGSMSLGESEGGLPPDAVIEDEEEILRDCQRVYEEFHEPDATAWCASSSPLRAVQSARTSCAFGEFARERGLRCTPTSPRPSTRKRTACDTTDAPGGLRTLSRGRARRLRAHVVWTNPAGGSPDAPAWRTVLVEHAARLARRSRVPGCRRARGLAVDGSPNDSSHLFPRRQALLLSG